MILSLSSWICLNLKYLDIFIKYWLGLVILQTQVFPQIWCILLWFLVLIYVGFLNPYYWICRLPLIWICNHFGKLKIIVKRSEIVYNACKFIPIKLCTYNGRKTLEYLRVLPWLKHNTKIVSNKMVYLLLNS